MFILFVICTKVINNLAKFHVSYKLFAQLFEKSFSVKKICLFRRYFSSKKGLGVNFYFGTKHGIAAFVILHIIILLVKHKAHIPRIKTKNILLPFFVSNCP